MKREALIAFLCGLLFAAGLGLSDMTSPSRVRGFLDILGEWNPSLIFVMVGAIGMHAAFYWLVIRPRTKPVIGSEFYYPKLQILDFKLVAGSALFGIGWGIAGYCPGPAVVSLLTLKPRVLVFLAALLVGMCVEPIVEKVFNK